MNIFYFNRKKLNHQMSASYCINTKSLITVFAFTTIFANSYCMQPYDIFQKTARFLSTQKLQQKGIGNLLFKKNACLDCTKKPEIKILPFNKERDAKKIVAMTLENKKIYIITVKRMSKKEHLDR